MEKIEKIFDSAWGVIIFYLVVALVSLLMVKSINNINNKIVTTDQESSSYLA